MTYKSGSVFVAAYKYGADGFVIRWWSTLMSYLEGKGWHKSTWSHVGIIVDENGRTFEARGRGLAFDTVTRYDGMADEHIRIYEPRDTVLGSTVALSAVEFGVMMEGEQYGLVQTFLGVPFTGLVRVLGKWLHVKRMQKAKILGGGMNCVEVTMRPMKRNHVDMNGLDEFSRPQQFAAWAQGSMYCGDGAA